MPRMWQRHVLSLLKQIVCKLVHGAIPFMNLHAKQPFVLEGVKTLHQL